MKPILNYIVASLLSLGGFSAFFLNPYRQGSVVVGIVLQSLCGAVLFLAAVEHKNSSARFEAYAKGRKSPILVLFLVKFLLYILCGALLIYGIQSVILRLVLFLIMWLAAISLGENISFYLWRARGKASAGQPAEQPVRERSEKEAEANCPQGAQAGGCPNAPETREAPLSVTPGSDHARARSQSLPDLLLIGRLRRGDTSALQEATGHPSAPALAAIEEAICRNNGNPDSVFYRMDGRRVCSSASIDAAKRELLDLAKNGTLLADPAYSQSLIARLGNRMTSTLIMRELAATDPAALFEYQLLGVQMQVAQLVGD